MGKLLVCGRLDRGYRDAFDLTDLYEDMTELSGIDLPMPYGDFSFDIALVSHGLFDDVDHCSLAFHLDSLFELARIAKEVRVYPLIDHLGQPSSLLGPVILGLNQANYGVEVREVKNQTYPIGHVMLRVWALQCDVVV